VVLSPRSLDSLRDAAAVAVAAGQPAAGGSLALEEPAGEDERAPARAGL
jgi:hypothetical protein